MVAANPFSGQGPNVPSPSTGQSLGELARTAVDGGVNALRKGCAAAGAAASAADRVVDHTVVQGVAAIALGFAKGIVGPGAGAGADKKGDKGLDPIDLSSEGGRKVDKPQGESNNGNSASGGTPSKKKEEEVGGGSQPT
jgi:hypothetical protein